MAGSQLLPGSREGRATGGRGGGGTVYIADVAEKHLFF